ncbi:hypothetical protein BAUCODRAFT_348426 [Baudoinia panamericana UAMH 10762]|uniref:Uncharacterized protein n=1 Tax=Baudoinia panamericana (strain UAMH 10762) TaxID=717646 RepID=M2NJY2_BAUPA|nr:uncharacterized protein BAUCODRAFT_348426 [Baudoinia panamericana UAMH 10762]EMC99739.1 hypothetical protein BAUCODRAFT_348426 [Baudoinia panamericana UAMH 10762]
MPSSSKAPAPEPNKIASPETPIMPDQAPKAVPEPSGSKQEPAKPAEMRKSSAPTAMQPASKGMATVQASDANAAPVTPTKSDAKKDEGSKRKHPGKLDITAAVNQTQDEPSAVVASSSKEIPTDVSTPSKPQVPMSRTPSIASKPESPGVSSPAIKSAPRTLRVVQTPKAETPPPQPFSTPALPTPGSGIKLPSRQPSVASINPPGTPSSEQISISDNISMTDTSLSRANSPPPGATSSLTTGMVGSAPVRTKTKNQLKKERQERAKAIEEEKAKQDDTVKPPMPEELTHQEAIISRKKKAKKEKEPKARPTKVREITEMAETTPTASRPVSPGQKAAVQEESQVPKVERVATPVKAPMPAPPPPIPAPHEPSPPPTPTLTAASLLAELKAQAPEIQKCIDSLFRTPTSAHFKANQNISSKDLHNPAFWKSDWKINLTKDEVEALLRGTVPAVHYGGQDGRVWDRGMVTPSGAHLRALTEELEARFLDLEKALREMPEDLRFHPSKPQNEIKFPNIDLEALKRSFDNASTRGPSVMEQMVQDGVPLKKGAFLVDEASKYINEFVMPPATPPPSAAGARSGQQTQAGTVAPVNPEQQIVQHSLEIVERQLLEAKRIAEENEGRLKKLIKKNKRLLGLG